MTLQFDSPEWLQMDGTERSQALLDDLAGSIKISPTIQKLMALTRRSDSVITPVVETLAKSPSLAAEVLKVANCPIYAHTREILDLKRAVVLIGMQELHAMAAGLSMLAIFSSDNEIAGTMHDTSVVSATIARQLAESLGQDPVNAFLCGLLCEIGALACNHKDADGYQEIWIKSAHAPSGRFTLESARYGIPSEITGSRLLTLNGLPHAITDAIQVSYEDAATTTNTLGKLTCFSRFASHVLVDAGRLGSRDILENGIRRLADHIGIHSPPLPQLIKLCLDAGMRANLGLRDKTELYKETLSMQDEISQNAEVGFDVDFGDAVETAENIRDSFKKNREAILLAALGGGVILVIIVMLLLRYF